jgi:phosphoacetylglucosamine mutase
MMQQLFNKYKKDLDMKFVYGTSGFRYDASLLEAPVFHSAVLMTLRAKYKRACCGIMITASHNDEKDNGVKLIDCSGHMIDSEWEEYATQLANTNTYVEFESVVHHIKRKFNLRDHTYDSETAYVLIGEDTRMSCNWFVQICQETIEACGGYAILQGKTTTPELHYNVANCNNHKNDVLIKSYCRMLLDNYRYLIAPVAGRCLGKSTILHVDCANGVGALKLQVIREQLSAMGLDIKLYNTGDGKLNHKCGADYVEKSLTFPSKMDSINEHDKCCSLDGDADRIVYFTKHNGKFCLLNGDKIACLMISYISDLLKTHGQNDTEVLMGFIQTPYANGASTLYVKNNMTNVSVEYAETGVKNLHKAATNYDIGAYFESNGHGSVHFDVGFLHRLNGVVYDQVKAISMLLSQYTGDALGNMLFVEVILQLQHTFDDWIKIYTDKPCKQLKLYIDKSGFEMSHFGTRCIKPVGLQDNLDTMVMKYSGSRAFLRPSGTEDIVRLYAECDNENELDGFVNDIITLVNKFV